MDEGSFALLHYLARHIQQKRVLLACTFRTGEGNFEKRMSRWAGNLPIPVRVLAVKTLDEADHEELLHQLSDAVVPKEKCREIYQLSEGVPLFAREFTKDRGDTAFRLLNAEKAIHAPGFETSNAYLTRFYHRLQQLQAIMG